MLTNISRINSKAKSIRRSNESTPKSSSKIINFLFVFQSFIDRRLLELRHCKLYGVQYTQRSLTAIIDLKEHLPPQSLIAEYFLSESSIKLNTNQLLFRQQEHLTKILDQSSVTLQLCKTRITSLNQHMLTKPEQINLWLKISHLTHVSIIYFFATAQCMIIEMFGIFYCAPSPSKIKHSRTQEKKDQDSHAACCLMSQKSGYE